MLYFEELLTRQLGLLGKIRFKILFYYRKSWICYLNPQKDESVELAFLRANELSNAQNLLDFKDRKQVGGISFYSLHGISEIPVMEIIQEAILLDELKPYASKRKKI